MFLTEIEILWSFISLAPRHADTRVYTNVCREYKFLKRKRVKLLDGLKNDYSRTELCIH